jgi:ABC-type uncharacterized transport system permease subunit
LTDSYGDGWNGNVLAFRQNNTIQTFTLPNGYQSGPFAFTFLKLVPVDVIVYTLGTWTGEVGFQLRTYVGTTVAARYSGYSFSANSKLLSFTPESLNLSPV